MNCFDLRVMLAVFHPSKSVSRSNSTSPSLINSHTQRASFVCNKPRERHRNLLFSPNHTLHGCKHLVLCSRRGILGDFSSIQVPQQRENDETGGNDELELLDKPFPVAIPNGSASDSEEESEDLDGEEALAPFLKFFKGKESLEEEEGEVGAGIEVSEEKRGMKSNVSEARKGNVDYYDPKPGDFVMGVVVSGNENKLDINVGADMLGTMLTKEVMPLYDREMEYLQCDLNKDTEDFMVRGKMGILKYDEALSSEPGPGRPVVDIGTVLFAEVLGRTLSGRPLLSTRRFFRRIAWHRVRQIKHLNEPIEVKIIEWNTAGLLTRIEGLRAFLPKVELLNRVNNYTELKENVGRRIQVLIKKIDEAKNDLILSEREAWEMINLREGTLLNGTVKRTFPYGAQIRIGETNRSGLLHISNISHSRIASVEDLFAVDEKVKVLVVKSMFPDKISLSIADLESEPGLFLSNKEKVFSEAEEMAKKYRKKLPAVMAAFKPEKPPSINFPFGQMTNYANWNWFRFEREPV
ncbi:hypothetical protein SAY87_018103 [Trapa incisa]|uniref:S1 motif domain-containing protein n=1 Tax=Trapa incisa TaxID=236973 RepID=A0AAN7QUX7_9MYRT|nr:hypothetical protein SAY87_018103 [Trapa incisa]